MTSITITTYEIVNKKMIPTVTHQFYGQDKKRAIKVLNAHRKTDAFFNASFTGNYKSIKLQNSDIMLERG